MSRKRIMGTQLLKDTLAAKISTRIKAAVVGAGIIGVSTAIQILELVPGVQVTLISEDFSPNTTGDGSAGFWCPYLLGDLPKDTLRKWCQDTYDFLLNLYLTPESNDYGIGLLSAYFLYEKPFEVPQFADYFTSYRKLTEKDLKLFPSQYKYGAYATTFYTECTKLIPFLMKRFQDKHGKIIKRKITSFSELAGEYHIVINCTGIGASQIVSDPKLKPIRGQVIRVKAPWVKHAILASSYYILPNSETIVLGGTSQVDDWNCEVDENDHEKIFKGCCEIVPSLKVSPFY
ncbi:D-aspartate oxidase-like isoform X1 [Centruroides sculpturatus]|uniref:D-aspartate oxidase-like isoform X1 n=2 Tax=Centruroides sculpturatus TaxID=218467 RepID=UPI000C6E5FAB|nr:D-aspartate oxidase-like isoform X1 [Centruroides sculpturatus]